MKRILLSLSFLLFAIGFVRAQGTHNITGSVIDSTKQTVPGASVKLKTDAGDSTVRVTGIDGNFTFANVKANKVTITITSIGYQGIVKHFNFANDNSPLVIGAVVLKNMSTVLGGVTIVGITPVTLKEDTTQYSAAAYKVRDNAPVEDLIKKLPGIDVDKDGAVTAKGKTVSKIRINGKDVFGGDLQSITKNLPADVVENIQLIDDYGDQANLTGVKSGDPNQIMNITIRKDKNYGYSANITAGGGKDALPSPQTNDSRYTGQLNSFKFKGDQQIYLLGNFNNVNANTFNFGGGGGGGNFGGGGGGGRGNASRGAGAGGSNGITDVHTAGLNFRDQWGQNLSVYGSYSFQDNVSNTNSTTKQQTNTRGTTVLDNQTSREINNTLNHRFTWNMEWKPDTLNYVKFTPTYSYSFIRTNYGDSHDASSVNNQTGVSTAFPYQSTTGSNSYAPNYGASLLLNHRFKTAGRNFSIFANASSAHTEQDQNPIYTGVIPAGVAPNQFITSASRVNNINTNVSYLEPLSKVSFLEFSYNFNYSHTTSERVTSAYNGGDKNYVIDPALSNDYRYTFTTNRLSLNYRLIEKNYNLTLGVGGQPSVLDGFSPSLGTNTHVSRFNFVPTARYQYTISKSQSLNVQYNGNANQPTFNQIQPVVDRSNALYPVEGNPDLTQEFSNNVNVRYNKFSFDSGDTFFFNVNYTQTDNKIVTNSVTFARQPGTVLTRYQNANGYWSTGGFANYSKPWDNRKFTFQIGGMANYANNVGYQTSVDSLNAETSLRNIAKTLTLAPSTSFRVDITDIIDTRISTSYSINKTDNSVKNNFTNASSNVRAWTIGLTGKNYLWKDWTVSYDLQKTNNYGYSIAVTNPTILNTYLERRFLKNNMATIRLSGNDLFNQNAGYSTAFTATSQTETNVNRLGRHFLLTLNIRLQKFAGKAPSSGMGDDRGPGGDRGGRGGDRGGRGGMGGPPGGGPGGF